MKFLCMMLIIPGFIISNQIHAKVISPCEVSCFEQQYICNIDKSFTGGNTCETELFDCRANCGHNNEDLITSKFPIDNSI